MRFFLLFWCTYLCAEWSAGGEITLLRPTVSRSYAAVESPAFSLNPALSTPTAARWIGEIHPPYAPGYRLYLQYNCARLGWMSWIHTNTFDKNIGTDKRLWPAYDNTSPVRISTFLSPATLRRKDHFKAQALDLQLSIPFANLLLFGGARYAQIRYNVAFTMEGLDEGGVVRALVTRWGSNTLGAGPRAGLYGHYQLWWDFFLEGEASASLLLGTIRGNYVDFKFGPGTTLGVVNGHFDPANLMITNAEVRFGAGYRFCNFEVSVGYEISYFSPAVVWTIFPDDEGKGVNQMLRDPFALDGWSLRIQGSY